ncbi:MAG: ABC transporter permease [Actinomycetota bacterium]
MRRLSSLGSKQLAHRKGRSALTALGIVLGVGILFGVLVTNATTQTGVDRLIKDFTGRANVLVGATGAFDATIPSSVVPRLAALPDVRAAVGSFNVDSSVKTPKLKEAEAVSLQGIVLEQARLLYDYRLRAGRFFTPGAGEIVIPERLALKLGVRIGDAIKLATSSGLQPMRITGVMTDTGAGRTNQGNVAFSSLDEVRALAQKGNVFSGASVVLAPGTKTDAWIAQHKDDLGAGLDFRNVDELAKGFRDFLNILGTVFTFFAALTLFIGAFLIYLTLSMAIIERTRIYGTMRALGATRRQVRTTVIAEALALGTASTIVGLAFGLVIAKGLLVLVSRLFQIDLPGLTIRPAAIGAGIAVGILTTLVSSLIPARRASKLSPIVAMKGDYARDTRLSRAWIAGAVAMVIGVAIALVKGSASGSAGTPLILLGSVLLTPLLLRPMAQLLGRVTNRIARGVGEVSVLHLVKERSRSAYTLALIMVVMAMIFSIGGLYTTLSATLNRSIDRQFGADIQIRTPGFMAAGTLGPAFEQALRAEPGVGAITTLRFAQVKQLDTTSAESDLFARIIDPATYFDLQSFSFVKGSENAARSALVRGGALLLPADRATALHKTVGDSVALETSQGSKPFRIAGTYAALGGPPEIVLGLPDATRYFNAGDPNAYSVNVVAGANVERVRGRIEADLGTRYNLRISTTSQIKADAKHQFGQFFNIFYAILLVAGVVGLLGLANTLAMSVLQRYREIGILRAVGTTRGQVRRMVLVESATLGLVAFALSLPMGLMLSILTVRGIGQAFGFKVPYIYPAGWVPLVAAFGIFVAVVAAIAPGRRAAHLEVVGALQFE